MLFTKLRKVQKLDDLKNYLLTPKSILLIKKNIKFYIYLNLMREMTLDFLIYR